jgi:putative ABC transport system ATP-binding protein
MDILTVQNLKKYYGKDETLVKAIDDISFSVEKGDFVAIIGPSGSGKSTLMHAIGGVDRPTDGKVLIDNQDIYQLSDEKLAIFRRRQVGLIYQFYNLIPILTVEENIKLPLLLDHQKVDDDKFNELVRQLGIDDRLNHLPNQLSGGQQQRVSIGRSLIYSPAIVLADEPTGNLDSDASREIIELLIDSNQRLNQTILIITHDERIAMRAKRILALKDGKIVRDERVRK